MDTHTIIGSLTYQHVAMDICNHHMSIEHQFRLSERPLVIVTKCRLNIQ